MKLRGAVPSSEVRRTRDPLLPLVQCASAEAEPLPWAIERNFTETIARAHSQRTLITTVIPAIRTRPWMRGPNLHATGAALSQVRVTRATNQSTG
jgi:hypothetical protein